MDKSCITTTDIICNALLEAVMNMEPDRRFTIKGLAQGYCNSDTITHMKTSAVYKQMYEQLLIRNLAYVGGIPEGVGLEDMVWFRCFSNGMYEIYKDYK
ncbi:hypothetical protein NFI00_000207 [Salmonella enterica]|nr:hypothetical protein [Salmonella enterica]